MNSFNFGMATGMIVIIILLIYFILSYRKQIREIKKDIIGDVIDRIKEEKL